MRTYSTTKFLPLRRALEEPYRGCWWVDLDRLVAEQEAARSRERRNMVGTGDRSAKIRTYNFPQNRVTDHRINVTLHRLADVIDGDLDELMDQLEGAYREERVGV